MSPLYTRPSFEARAKARRRLRMRLYLLKQISLILRCAAHATGVRGASKDERKQSGATSFARDGR
jgi:hypothetical protein